jgi:AcrR family transcriptional regulator
MLDQGAVIDTASAHDRPTSQVAVSAGSGRIPAKKISRPVNDRYSWTVCSDTSAGGRVLTRASRERGAATRRPSEGAASALEEEGSRGEILRVAIRLFAERGFDGVSVRDIAAACGANLPTIYYFFGDKRSLYLQACLGLFETRGRDHARALHEDGSPQQRLFSFLVRLIDSLSHDREFAGLLQREILERDVKGIRTLTRAVFRTQFEEVAKLCRELGSQGDAALTAHTIFALFFGLAQLRPIARELGTAREIETSESLARHVLTVVLPHVNWTKVQVRKSPGRRRNRS